VNLELEGEWERIAVGMTKPMNDAYEERRHQSFLAISSIAVEEKLIRHAEVTDKAEVRRVEDLTA
jgi:hypothetical protein